MRNVLLIATARNVLLKPEEVKMWFDHLEVVKNNRKEGAKKAAANRKARNQSVRITDAAHKQPLKDSDDEEVCNKCYAFNPPELPNNNDENIDWVACNNCSLWFHQFCSGLQQVARVWFCNTCSCNKKT